MTPSTEMVYQERFSKGLIRLFSDACRINRFNPSQCLFWIRTYFRQRSRAAARNEAGSEKLNIPPLLILSGTNRCNLNCKGCYASSRSESHEELSLDRIESLFQEASDLGVGVIMIAGGEPLMKPEILWLAGKQKEIIFPVFTNGMLLNKGSISYFKHHKNLIPVLSVEGGRALTDKRRGTGVYSQLVNRMEQLKKARQIFGLSLTLTSENFNEVTNPDWIRSHSHAGGKIFFLVDYVPQSENEMHLCLTHEQKASLPELIENLRATIPALFISLPGDEEKFGGCLAGGRGFAHISASGKLEPCPFAPYSDTDLNKKSLREALQSPFMKIIRESHHIPGEAQGGCILWENRDWVNSQLEDAHAQPA